MVYQMAKEFATRRYQLTINNPKEHGYDHDTIKAILAKGAKLLYWCMCDEEGKEETYHTHLYLVFCNAVMFKTLKNKFPTAHIEVPQWGTNSENYAYIRKEGTKYHKDANGHYEYTDAQGKVHVGTNFSDTFEESGDLPPDAKQGDRNDLRMLYKLIASGEDNAQILGEHPEYLRDISHIDRTRQTILEEKYRNVFRRMNVTYISGPTGVGKTRSVREGCGYANCYSVSDYKHPFDGYRGQAAILFDEFHNSLPLVNVYQDLKQNHPQQQHIWDKKQRYKWDRQPITSEQISLIHKLAPDYKIDTKKMTRGDASRVIQLLAYAPKEQDAQEQAQEVQDDAT